MTQPSKPAATSGKKQSLWVKLGQCLITGAADDDPSGIATHSQVGARFGYAILWIALFTLPLMVGIQSISAHIGRVTGQGLAANIRRHYPPWLLGIFLECGHKWGHFRTHYGRHDADGRARGQYGRVYH